MTLATAVMIAGAMVVFGIVYKLGLFAQLKALLAKAPVAPAAPGAPAPLAPAPASPHNVAPTLAAIINSATSDQLAKLIPLVKLEEARAIRSMNDQAEAMEAKNLELKATIHTALGNVFKLTDVATAPKAPAAPAAPTA